MNLKFSLILILISFGIGIGAGYKLFYKSIPPAEQKSQNLKITKFDRTTGRPSEIIERQSMSQPVIQDNLLFLLDKREISAIIKIEHLHFGLGYDYKNPDIIYKVGYSTRIF